MMPALIRVALSLSLVGALAACGGGSDDPPADSGAPRGDAGPPRCSADVDCNDGDYCNGVEVCAPASDAADVMGCIDGTPPSCGADEMCDEEADACQPVCAVEPDADGDGALAAECGGDDCDDTDPDRFPGNVEVCDAFDVDEDCDPATFGIRDLDADGSLDAACCNVDTSGTRTCGDDCDDTRRIVNPTTSEVCDGFDNDCDATVDEGVEQARYADADGDGFGDPAMASTGTCEDVEGFSVFPTDCDDDNSGVFPGAVEVCDGLDTNCDGIPEDVDGDGHAAVDALCSEAGGTIARDDCDDGDPTIFPGAAEVCDGVDSDCDGVVDDRGDADPLCDALSTDERSICTAGACRRTTCADGRGDCNGAADDGCETDLETDASHCGGCGLRCVPGAACVDALCEERRPVELHAAGSLSCVLYDDGTAGCWGEAVEAYGTATPTEEPTLTAETLVDALDLDTLAVGRQHACAIRSGQLLCWGYDFGQLGFGTAGVAVSLPTEVPGMNDVVAASTSLELTCVIRSDASLWCAGGGSQTSVGDGTLENRASFVQVATGVRAVDVDFLNVCYIRDADGQVLCWGRNDSGVLGQPASPGSVANSPVEIPGLSGVTEVSVGGTHACARRPGEVLCWGKNREGQLGRGVVSDVEHVPAAVPALDGATLLDLSVGLGACAVVADPGESSGLVYCWGWNVDGSLGDGTFEDRSEPTLITGIDRIVDVDSPSDPTTCALREDGAVFCWGDGRSYKRGDGRQEGSLSPVPVLAFSEVADVTAGRAATCVRSPSGGVRCWGMNERGELATGASTGVEPAPVASLLTDVRHLALGERFGCAVRVDGGVVCWGGNEAGQLGDGTTDDSATPVAVMGLSGTAVAVTAGRDFACARLADGTVACWGADNVGQLGSGTPSGTRSTAALVSGLTDVVEVLAGAQFACARRGNGEVWCWGADDYGQLGVGGAFTPGVAAPVVEVDDATLLSVAARSACALTRGELLRCWGTNFVGEYGDGTNRLRRVPNEGVLLPGLESITAGYRFRFAIQDGAPVCWGANYEGQLGLDSRASSFLEPQPFSLDDLRQVGAGSTSVHACAVTGARQVYCWGGNDAGQLGIGAAGDIERAPLAVTGL